MRSAKFCWRILFFISALCLTSLGNAQTSVIENAATANTSAEAPAVGANKTPSPDKSTKKMVQDATINLQTTVTGNQEQPRVLYILPWQSPAPEDVDFASFSNDQRVIFEHVEREELRRELEASGEE